jgi:hypothetical protein
MDDNRILQSLGAVAERLAQINKRIDHLQALDAQQASARADAARDERVRRDALVMAEAAREDAARHKAEQNEIDRQERYRQRRILDHESGKFSACAQIFNTALSGFGRSVEPAPEGMSYTRYLRYCTDKAQRYLPASHSHANFNFLDPDSVPKNVLVQFSDTVLNGVKQALRDPSTVAKGKMRRIENKDPYTGVTSSIEYIGETPFTNDPQYGHQPGRRIVAFNGVDGRPWMFP